MTDFPFRRVIEPVGDGSYLCFNEVHKKEEVVRWMDGDEAKDYAQKGWKVIRVEGKLMGMAPEIPLADLSEPWKNPVGEPEDIIACRKGLYYSAEFLEEKYGAKLLRGVMNDVETRFSVPDKSVAEELLGDSDHRWPGYFELDTTPVLEGNECFKELLDWYSVLGVPEHRLKDAYAKVPAGFWEKQEQDVVVFVPLSGVKFAASYLHSHPDEKVAFYELHTSGDYVPDSCHFDAEDVKGKTVAIIDKCYSGGTLRKLKGKLEEMGAKVEEVVALWPKSYQGIIDSGATHIYWGTQKFTVDEIMLGDGWSEELCHLAWERAKGGPLMIKEVEPYAYKSF